MEIWIKELKEQWNKLTWVGKIVIFPIILIVIASLCWFSLLFDSIEKLGRSLVRLMTKIFFKP